VIGLKDTLLFGAMMLMVALVFAPVWPKEQIYGKSILFLVQMGAVIPSSPGAAASFRQQMMNVVQLYQGLNLLHYLFLSAFILFFVVHLFRIHRKLPGYKDSTWISLGLLLMIFPAVNLVLSWSLFLSPGVLGTALAAIAMVISGKFLK
jgi:hypothetical protein